MKRQRRTRPPLPERHARLLELGELNRFIEELEIAYEETANEKVLGVLSRLRAVKEQELSLEQLYQEEELREFWKNPSAFPFSVRTWFMSYRDDEIQ